MNTRDLKEAVNKMEMKDKMKKEVAANVKRQMRAKGKGRRRSGWQKAAAAAVIFVAACGVLFVPVRAFVNSCVQERMEEMTKGEKEEIADALKQREAEADGFSREYTEKEAERRQALYQAYVQGTFPEQELPQADSEAQAEQYELCYLKTTGIFCLPERELTDEELLEIIDFTLKRDYVVTQEAEENDADEKVQPAAEGDGISQQQAEESAVKYLTDIYQVTGQGMDFGCYYKGPEEDFAGAGVENYLAVWRDIINHDFYSVCLNAHNGALIYAAYTGEQIPDGIGIKVEEAEKKIEAFHGSAAELLQKEGIKTCQKEYVFYEKYDDGTTTEYVKFLFVTEDGSTYTVEYGGNGMLSYYGLDDLSGYQDGIGRTDFVGNVGKRVESVLKQL